MDSLLRAYECSTGRKLPPNITMIFPSNRDDYISKAVELFLKVGGEPLGRAKWEGLALQSQGLTIYSDNWKDNTSEIYIIIDGEGLAKDEWERIVFHELGHVGTIDIFSGCQISRNDIDTHAGYELLKELFACYDSHRCLQFIEKSDESDDVYKKCYEYYMKARIMATYSFIEENATSLAECLSVLYAYFKNRTNDRLSSIVDRVGNILNKEKISFECCKNICNDLFFSKL